MAIRVMVAAVATDEPQMAPNAPEAQIVATARPPRNPDMMTRAAEKSSDESREEVAISPIRTNSGTTDRPYLEAMSNVVDPAMNWAT